MGGIRLSSTSVGYYNKVHVIILTIPGICRRLIQNTTKKALPLGSSLSQLCQHSPSALLQPSIQQLSNSFTNSPNCTHSSCNDYHSRYSCSDDARHSPVRPGVTNVLVSIVDVGSGPNDQ